jgi:23S rRNA U2552 (ribose-2'-O)-methylase RlmE/FtsJ
MLNKTSFTVPPVNTINMKVLKGDREKNLQRLGFDPILNTTKNKISHISYSKWTRLRKAFNDFEFLIDLSKISKPVSRAYFKLLEMMGDHKLVDSNNSLHLAEAPGGFIEATRYLKNREKITGITYYTFSVLGDVTIPTYNRNLIYDRNILVLSNKKNRGDLYSIENIKTLISKIGDKNISFITCDGGFTENNDFASKEQLHHHLIFNEIVTSIFILKDSGNLIVKIFDIFTELTFDFVYLLSYLFKEVYISKPNTSRPTSSEKYIICKGFIKSRLDKKLEKFIMILCQNGIENYSSFIDKSYVNSSFISSIKDINVYFLKYQVFNINSIIEMDTLNIKMTKSKENMDDWIANYY